MKSFVFGFVVGIVLLVLAVFGYFVSGRVPVGTLERAMPFERTLAGGALRARIQKEMPKAVPIPANEATYLAGAQIYKDQCAVCHGAPGNPITAIAKGMFPKPPQLFRGKGVTDDEPGETYWKVANGIRLSGMPGFKQSLTEAQMWQVSLLLANADKLPGSVKQALGTSAAFAAPVSLPGNSPASAPTPAVPAASPTTSPETAPH